jgi:GDP-L-fucose synthase
VSSGILHGRSIAVTGGAGFLGRVVVEHLAARTGAAPFVPRSRDYDLRTAAGARRLMEDARPDVVVHLAAVVGGIGANRDNPGRYFHDNLLMGAHVIEACRAAGVGKVVCVGTVCSYPKHTPVPFREDDLWSGYPEETNAPYGVAKKALLVQLQAYRAQYGQRAAYVLPANLYGPGDNFDPRSSHVIPALVRKCVEARRAGADSVDVWGTGRATREFLYVDDCAEAVVRAAERIDDPEPINLGTGREISIAELAGRIARIAGFAGRLGFDPRHPDGQPRRCLDTTRARERLGWVAGTSLDDGLERTVRWYEAQGGGP